MADRKKLKEQLRNRKPSGKKVRVNPDLKKITRDGKSALVLTDEELRREEAQRNAESADVIHAALPQGTTFEIPDQDAVAPEPVGFQIPEPEKQPFDLVNDLIRLGDFESAGSLIDTLSKGASTIEQFKRSTRPEALVADQIRAFQERREGRTPQFAQSNLPVFAGEERAPFDLAESLRARRFKEFGDIAGIREAKERRNIIKERNKELADIESDRLILNTTLGLQRLEQMTKQPSDTRIENLDKIRQTTKEQLGVLLDLLDSDKISPEQKEKIRKKFNDSLKSFGATTKTMNQLLLIRK